MSERLKTILCISGCITLMFITTVICITVYHNHDRVLMAENISESIEKGINPISVRCSYAESDDMICANFALQIVDNLQDKTIVADKSKKK